MRGFPKKAFHKSTNFSGQKIYEEFVLNKKTNDQIMRRFARGFINDKCIYCNLNTNSSLKD